jgi:hypothetical protein
MTTNITSHVAWRSHRFEGNTGASARSGLTLAVAMIGGMLAGACSSQPQYIYVTAGSGAGKGAGGNGVEMKSDSQKEADDAAGAGGMSKKPASSSSTQTNSAGSGDDDSTPSASAGGQGGSGGTAPAAAGSGGQGGMAPNTIAACKDKAGQNACDGNRLYHCLDAGGQEPLGTCANAMRCTAGIKSGQCGTCDPGEFDCQDALLMMCDDTGTWAMSMQCASAELCSKQNHSCDPMACAKDAYNCMGDELQQCTQDLTGFQTVMTCEPGLCDQKDGKCYECMPNTKSCDGSSLVTCDGDGKKTETACSGDKRYCLKDSCVECMSDTDCMSTSECRPAKCDTSTGMCTMGTPKAAETPCSTGGGTVCDLTGSCVACLTDADCHSSQLRCLTAVSCVNKNAIEATPLLGSYTVNITPGYAVSVTTDPSANIQFTPAIANNMIHSAAATQSFVVSAGTSSTFCSINPLELAGDVVTLRFGNDVAGDDSTPGSLCSMNTSTVVLSATQSK